MNQQINLYQPMFRKQEKVFSAVAMLQVLLLLIVALVAFYGYSWWSLQPFEQELGKVESEQRRLQAEINRLEAESPAPVKSELLEEEIERLSREIEQKGRVARIISSGRFGNRTGFASALEGLARQHISGLWLTRVHLEEGGRQLALTGKANSSELVPRYIQRLADEPVFRGLSFNVLDIRRSDDEPGIVEFELATRLPAGKS